MAFQRKKPAAVGSKASSPGFVEPALASSIERVPTGERWVHETKFDGYRIQVHLANESIRVFSRRGNDWTRRFKKIADDAWHISAGSAIIDGEVVVPAADGTTDFSVLQNELEGRSTKIVMVAFDLLYLNGYDLRQLPLFQRKEFLKKLIAGTAIQFSESFEIDGKEMYQHACRTGLEGVVSKVRDSKYPSGRSNDWVKKTCAQRGTLAFAGFALDGNKWDGLYIGRRKGKDLIYVGKVDHGFDSASAKMLPRPPYAADPKDATLHKTDCASRYLGRTRTIGRSNIGRSQPRAKCGIPSSRACGKICDDRADRGAAQGIPTARGCKWSLPEVTRILQRTLPSTRDQ